MVLRRDFPPYLELVPEETFTERFNRLTGHMSEQELCYVLDLSAGAVHKIRDGRTQSLKLDSALRLCERIKISPWYLAGRADPVPSLSAKPQADAAAEIESVGLAAGSLEAALRELTKVVRDQETRLAALETGGAKTNAPRRKAS
jgi:hypothetical protein